MNEHPTQTQFRVDPAPLMRGDERTDGPIILVVVSLTFPGMDAKSYELMSSFTRIAFDAMREVGARPRLVDSAATDLAGADEIFANADGMLFLGGGDVDGELFGLTSAAPKNSYGVDRRADDYCIDLIRESVRRDLPTLAICRGSQLLNVAFGGSLIPDLEPWELHRGGPGAPMFLDEEILLEEGSIIAEILGRTRASVRSGHHQAVDRVADSLAVTARAHDGVVEGTQHRDASWVIGLQWHPEEPAADRGDRARVFRALADRAAR